MTTRNPNLCMVGWKCYQILHRIRRCPRCGADPGERCLGRTGPIEASHLDRKFAFRAFRLENPGTYLLVRDAVVAHLITARPLELPAFLVLEQVRLDLAAIRHALEKACTPRKAPTGAQ